MDTIHVVTMETESSPPPPTKRNEFFVDTKTTCFLCLNEIPPVINLENGEDEKQVEGKIFCMRAIFRYLKMNPGVLFKTQLTGSLLDSAKLLNKISDWKVLLCRECIPFANRLSELCRQMEMVQMKVDNSLQLFQEIIDKSEKDSMKVEKFRGKLTNPLETLQATIADLLRNETREKCNGSLKTSKPRVTLTKCEKFFTFVGIKESVVSPAISSPRPPPPLPVSLPLQPPPPVSLPLQPPPPILVPISKNLMNPASVRCKLCSSAFGSQQTLNAHIRRLHPESDIHSASELIPVKVKHKCHLCNAICSSSKSLKKHINNRHNSIFHTCNACGLKLASKPEWIKHTRLYCDLRRTNTTSQGRITIKLEKPPPVPMPPPPPPLPPPPPVCIEPTTSLSQTTTVSSLDLSKLMNPIPHFRTGNNELLCSLCPVRSSNDIFRREDQLKRHLFLKHVDYFFSPVKLPEVSKEQFETYCQQIIENDMKLTTHQNTSGFSGRASTYTCVHCSSLFYERRAMNAHLIQSHYFLLVPKLMDLQRKSTTKQIVTPPSPPVSTPPPPSISLPQPPPPSIISPFKTQWVPRRQLKCANCSAVFSQSSSLSRHKKLNCPGIFATSKAIKGHKGSSQLTDRGNVGRFKCTDCGAWFVQKTSLFRHRKRWHTKNGTSTLPTPPPPAPKNLPKAAAQESSDCPFVCDHCDNRFSTYRGKKRHMKNCYKKPIHDGEDGDLSLGPMVTSTFSLSTSTTPTPAQNLLNSWPCQNCGSSFISSSLLRKHQQQYCHNNAPVGAVSSQEHNQGISVGIENYYDENYISSPTESEVMGAQEEEEVYPGSYVSTKIEVLEFQQVQICTSNLDNDNNEIEEIEEMNNLYQESLIVNEDGDEEIIFAGGGSSVDPLC